MSTKALVWERHSARRVVISCFMTSRDLLPHASEQASSPSIGWGDPWPGLAVLASAVGTPQHYTLLAACRLVHSGCALQICEKVAVSRVKKAVDTLYQRANFRHGYFYLCTRKARDTPTLCLQTSAMVYIRACSGSHAI
jgi:hypothetical protein